MNRKEEESFIKRVGKTFVVLGYVLFCIFLLLAEWLICEWIEKLGL